MNRLAGTHSRSKHAARVVYRPRPLTGSAAAHAEALGRNEVVEQELVRITRQRDALQRALFDAAQVQRKLSGPRFLRRGDFEIAAESFASQDVTGDLLAAFDAGGRTLFAIGDICGKGLYAGMWFTHLAGLIRLLARSCPGPAEIAAAINAHFSSLQPAPPMATLFLGSLDPASGELVYCNAGHPAPLLLRANGQEEGLSAGGPLLGAVAEACFSAGRLSLVPGDTLVGYSDGVVESRNGDGEDFDHARLVSVVRNAGGGSAADILFSVLAATQDFAAAQPRSDDVAVLVVQRRPQAAAERMRVVRC